jgi:predicted GIY-YIG superfamily endonuclease
LPVDLIYAEELPDRSTAMQRERQIKSMAKKRKKDLVSKSEETTIQIIETIHTEEATND